MVMSSGIFTGWVQKKGYGFIKSEEGDVFLHVSQVETPTEFYSGCTVSFKLSYNEKGKLASDAKVTSKAEYPTLRVSESDSSNVCISELDSSFISDEVEELDISTVNNDVITEVSNWKLEAKGEDNHRYFWHVREVDAISRGDKCYVIGRKGSGKTAICEYFSNIDDYNVFSEKLSFKNFPFNELYEHKNLQFTKPNQFISIWKYLIYSSICRMMLVDNSIDQTIRDQLASVYDDKSSLGRRVKRWVSNEFGLSLLGVSIKLSRPAPKHEVSNWIENVNFLEDLILNYVGQSKYYVLFDELDEDYRDMITHEQSENYSALITSLFKAVQDIRTVFKDKKDNILPIVFLRDDIYDLITDSDKNKWRDFRVDLSWDAKKIKNLIAFRISRAINCDGKIMGFPEAWSLIFGKSHIGVGTKRSKTKISTFDFICRSTLLRPRDFVLYLQSCAQYAIDNGCKQITPQVVRSVDKAFSNYLRQELTDELFAVLPDIANIFDTISQLRKWNFSITEFEKAYNQRVDQGFIQEKNVKLVLQTLYLFSVIGNNPRPGYYVFRYQNRESRLNYNERVIVHRGLFKALQIL